MSNIKVPAYSAEFFNHTVPNPLFREFKYEQSEIVIIIYDYLDYHTSKHPNCNHVINLLLPLTKWLFATELRFLQAFNEIKYAELQFFLEKQLKIITDKLNENNAEDNKLLMGAYHYALRVIQKRLHELKNHLNDNPTVEIILNRANEPALLKHLTTIVSV